MTHPIDNSHKGCAPQALCGTRRSQNSALVINLFGGPGSGKSTLAARLFYELKLAHIEAACPEEHAKLALYSGQPWLLDEQIVLLGRTWETIHALTDKVEVIIVDSPILLCSSYAGKREPACFHDLVLDMHRRTDRINIFLERDLKQSYSTNGRRESETQAHHVDNAIRSTLVQTDEDYTRHCASDSISTPLIDLLLARRSQTED
jgi:adenylate kinase family enzyme